MPPMESAFYIPAFGALLSALAWMARMWAIERAECKSEVAKREALAERTVVALTRANTVADSILDWLERYDRGEVDPQPVRSRFNPRNPRGGRNR